MLNIQLQYSIVLASFLLAWLWAERRFSYVFWLSLLVILGALELASYVFFNWMFRMQKKEAAQLLDDVDLPPAHAKELALEKLKCLPTAVAAKKAPAIVDMYDVPASVRDLFCNYESIILDGVEFDVTSLSHSRCCAGFIKIGSGDDGTEIVVRPGDDRVWEIEGGEIESAFENSGYRSIWHFLLATLN